MPAGLQSRAFPGEIYLSTTTLATCPPSADLAKYTPGLRGLPERSLGSHDTLLLPSETGTTTLLTSLPRTSKKSILSGAAVLAARSISAPPLQGLGETLQGTGRRKHGRPQ